MWGYSIYYFLLHKSYDIQWTEYAYFCDEILSPVIIIWAHEEKEDVDYHTECPGGMCQTS